ncbi:winged helix-turn-helix domain-containing protein [Streptosporangium sp. KLBMP 9127]|nr:helix-turn-helix domain-containing protein [Streptosporangium sp. KLBMP 9127]
MSEVFRVTDPRTLKAVAHPLRARMLSLLRFDGPATATELARKVGESSGLTSYHLRELARYGFIEEDPEQRDARERRWRAAHMYTSWRSGEMSATPEGREADEFMRRRQIANLLHDHEAFGQRMDTMSREWVDASGMADEIVRLTPGSMAALWEHWARFSSALQELARNDAGDPAAEEVAVYMYAIPRDPEGE